MNLFRALLKHLFVLWKKRYQIQKFTLRIQGARIGEKNTFNAWLKVTVPDNFVLGNNNVFNEYVVVNSKGKVTIGDNNHFSTGVLLVTTRLNEDLTSHLSYELKINNNNWFAANSIVSCSKQNLEIGSNIVIAANSFISVSILEQGTYFSNKIKKVQQE